MSQHSDYQEAFKRIHQIYFESLRSYAERKIRDTDEAASIVTDAFEKLYKRKVDFSDGPGIERLLRRMIKDACIDYFRRKKAAKKRADRHARDKYDDDASEKPAGERQETEKELVKILADMLLELDKLPEKSGDTLRKIYFDGMTAKELAKLRGIRVTSVHNLKKHALDLLRKRLEDRDMRIWLTICVLLNNSQINVKFFI